MSSFILRYLKTSSFSVTPGNFSARSGPHGYSDCLWNELPGQERSHPQRPGCQELCVSATGLSASLAAQGCAGLVFSARVTVALRCSSSTGWYRSALRAVFFFSGLMTHFRLRSPTMPSPETCSPWTITAWGTTRTGQFAGWLWKVSLIMSFLVPVMW